MGSGLVQRFCDTGSLHAERSECHPSLCELTPLDAVDLHACRGYALHDRLLGPSLRRLAGRATLNMRAQIYRSGTPADCKIGGPIRFKLQPQ
jgi:hypothetical protein